MKIITQITIVFCFTLSCSFVSNQVAPDSIKMIEKTSVKLAEKSNSFTDIYTFSEIFRDTDKRISAKFDIPAGLYWRTSFWFDIYTRYDSKTKVVHHKKYPWIIFDTIDTTGISRRNRRRFVRKKRRQTIKVLANLARKRTFRHLKGEERRIFKLLKQIPGRRRSVIAEARKNIRTQTGQREHFISGLKRSSAFLTAMEEHFRSENLPVELTRLPLVESSFNKHAISKVGASGVWQIMPRVGRKLMRVNRFVDERNSPFKATLAAARLLKEKMRSLKHWPLAVTAYNTGPTRVRRAVKKLKTTNIARIIENYKSKSFGFASKNFYAEFLAALYAEKYQTEIFGNLVKLKPLRYDIYQLTGHRRFYAKEIAKLSEISTKELLNLNFDLRHALLTNRKLPRNFMLYLPEGKGLLLDKKIRQQATTTSQVSLSSGVAPHSQHQLRL